MLILSIIFILPSAVFPDTRQSSEESSSNSNANEKRINGYNNDHKSSRSHSSIGGGGVGVSQLDQSTNGERNQLLLLTKGRGSNHNQDEQQQSSSKPSLTKPAVTQAGFDLKKILALTPPKGDRGDEGYNSGSKPSSSLTTTTASLLPTQPSLVQSLQPAQSGPNNGAGDVQTTTPRFGISSSSILSSKTTSSKTNSTSSNNLSGKKKE